MNLRAYKKIVLFGGSFDPPHLAHIKLPMIAMNVIGADAVAYIPSGVQPFKQHALQTPAHHRLAMLRLALQDIPHAVVLTDEITRATTSQPESAPRKTNAPTDSPTYTVDTIEALRKQLEPHIELCLLIGSDQLKVFDTWRQPERIIELAQPLVMVRPPDTLDTVLGAMPKGYDPRLWASRLIELPPIDISSTQIRNLIAQGQPISSWVTKSVEDYIHRHRLYRGDDKS